MGLHCPNISAAPLPPSFNALQLWRAPMSKPGPDDTRHSVQGKLSQVVYGRTEKLFDFNS
jgi:hypothetical protein